MTHCHTTYILYYLLEIQKDREKKKSPCQVIIGNFLSQPRVVKLDINELRKLELRRNVRDKRKTLVEMVVPRIGCGLTKKGK